MRRVFVDTSAFVALRNRSEREHEAARRTLEALVLDATELITTNYVFAETYTALLVRVSRHEAVLWGRHIRASEALAVVRLDEDADERAWHILESHQDKAWSYVDATSFAFMEHADIREAFSFDRNFVQRGLRVVPDAT